MSNEGDVRWFKLFAGDNPALDTAAGIYNQDRCRGITYDEENDVVGVLIQTKAQGVRNVEYRGNFYDTILITMDRSGNIDDAVTIS